MSNGKGEGRKANKSMYSEIAKLFAAQLEIEALRQDIWIGKYS